MPLVACRLIPVFTAGCASRCVEAQQQPHQQQPLRPPRARQRGSPPRLSPIPTHTPLVPPLTPPALAFPPRAAEKKGLSANRIGNIPLSALRQIGDVVLVHDESGLYEQDLDARMGFVNPLGLEVRTAGGEFLGKVGTGQGRAHSAR